MARRRLPHQEETTVNTGAGTDTVDIKDVTDLLFVYGQADADTMTRLPEPGSAALPPWTGGDGGDVFNVKAMNGAVNVNGGIGADTVNVGSHSQGTFSDPDNNISGTVNAISALLSIDGGTGSERDLVTVDDTADGAANTGVLTASRVTGLGMGNASQSVVESTLGITYSNVGRPGDLPGGWDGCVYH